jgi:predicted metal-dependent hydrolase
LDKFLETPEKEHPSEFYKGLDYFNRGFYFECHDAWEEVWAEAKGKEKIFYQGLIMAAVSLYHFENENLEGALSCYQKALKQFRQLPDLYLSLNLRELAENLEAFYRGLPIRDEKELQCKPRPRIQLEGSR